MSKAYEGLNELLTGLRPIVLPTLPGLAEVEGVFVGNYLDRYKQILGPTAVVMVGKSHPDVAGWMMLLVVDRRYNRRSRAANEKTACFTVEQFLPHLPEWLALLTPQAA